VKSRVAEIKEQVKDAKSDYDKEKLNERAAKLAGGVAVVKVGAATEMEMKERKARVEDALHATRAAVEEGVLPGGGVALLRARAKLGEVHGANADQQSGVDIVLRALEEPLRQIVANSGGEPSVVLDRVLAGDHNFGFNALTDQYGDMVEMGVLDPCKVTRTALQNAASVAGLILTTRHGCRASEIITRKPVLHGGNVNGTRNQPQLHRPQVVPGSADELEGVKVIERPDGFWVLLAVGGREMGPYATLVEAIEDSRVKDDDEFGTGDSLAEAEAQLGVADWIDPETSAPAEDSVPHLEDH
jgi:hypothetical protein